MAWNKTWKQIEKCVNINNSDFSLLPKEMQSKLLDFDHMETASSGEFVSITFLLPFRMFREVMRMIKNI